MTKYLLIATIVAAGLTLSPGCLLIRSDRHETVKVKEYHTSRKPPCPHPAPRMHPEPPRVEPHRYPKHEHQYDSRKIHRPQNDYKHEHRPGNRHNSHHKKNYKKDHQNKDYGKDRYNKTPDQFH